jgi:hypothetical protein
MFAFITPAWKTRAGATFAALCLALSSAAAQQDTGSHDHSQHDHPQHGNAATDHSMHGNAGKEHQQDHSQHGTAGTARSQEGHTRHRQQAKKKAPSSVHDGHAGHRSQRAAKGHTGHPAAPGHGGGTQTAQHGEHGGMKGFLGPYSMSREGSGTSWVPDTTPHEGVHNQIGEWSTMWHGYLNLIYDHQGGPRGADKTFVNGMVMRMAQRPLGDGTLGLRAMLSPDPFMGKSGYPLLLASGETANGQTHLIDRQHPHDLFMELAGTYSRNLSALSSLFIYAGLPGEPALGPPAFMHRTSGVDIPEAPITHHWLDSTHITFGVVTAGLIVDKWKMEASAFRGREPDQYRYDIEAPKLDSFSARFSWNPIRELSMQVSWGRLHSPEQLVPNVDEDRITASAIYTQPFGEDNIWSTTAAWGRKILRPGQTLDGYLLESTVIFKNTYALFARAERLAETELHEDIPALDGQVLMVNKLTVGGIYDFYRTDHVKFGIGALVSKYALPGSLKPAYGSDPTSAMVFMRLKVI